MSKEPVTGILAIDVLNDVSYMFAQEDDKPVRVHRARGTNGKTVYLRMQKSTISPYLASALCKQMSEHLSDMDTAPLPVMVQVTGHWAIEKDLSGQQAIVMTVLYNNLITDTAVRAPFILRPKAPQAVAPEEAPAQAAESVEVKAEVDEPAQTQPQYAKYEEIDPEECEWEEMAV